jgi:hypothetical protein
MTSLCTRRSPPPSHALGIALAARPVKARFSLARCLRSHNHNPHSSLGAWLCSLRIGRSCRTTYSVTNVPQPSTSAEDRSHQTSLRACICVKALACRDHASQKKMSPSTLQRRPSWPLKHNVGRGLYTPGQSSIRSDRSCRAISSAAWTPRTSGTEAGDRPSRLMDRRTHALPLRREGATKAGDDITVRSAMTAAAAPSPLLLGRQARLEPKQAVGCSVRARASPDLRTGRESKV